MTKLKLSSYDGTEEQGEDIETTSGGNINVLSKYPMYVDGKRVSPADYYHNADATPPKKNWFDTLSGDVKKLQDSGVVDAGKSIYDSAKGKGGKPTDSTITPPTTIALAHPADEKAKRGMGLPVKIAIGVAVAVAVYFGYKHFTKKK